MSVLSEHIDALNAAVDTELKRRHVVESEFAGRMATINEMTTGNPVAVVPISTITGFERGAIDKVAEKLNLMRTPKPGEPVVVPFAAKVEPVTDKTADKPTEAPKSGPAPVTPPRT